MLQKKTVLLRALLVLIEFGFDDMTDSLGRTYHQKPQPYMRPAYDTKQREAVKEVEDVLRLLIEQV